jgi:hypothetical protein
MLLCAGAESVPLRLSHLQVVYVISQLPTSRMSGSFDIEGLKRLQRRCHRTCLSLESFYQENVTLVQVATIMLWVVPLLCASLTLAPRVAESPLLPPNTATTSTSSPSA